MVKQEDINTKAQEFAHAIEKYNTFSWYIAFENMLACIVVTLQIYGIVNLIQTYQYNGPLIILFTLVTAYVTADFINGLVHMILDNNTSYASKAGPFIAAFHLHHFRRKYTQKHPVRIYFTESGHKFWLVAYLLILTTVQHYNSISANLNLGLVAFGIFSSIAEVSHYWCHNATKSNPIIPFLQKYRILLSLQHHRIHHTEDNKNYAFLNGISDPLLNLIAKNFCNGYKSRSDMHVSTYIAQQRTQP